MMKICLISAPTANDFLDENLVEMEAIKAIAEHAPLGILSLAAVLEQNGTTPDIIDLNRLYYKWIHSDQHKRLGVEFDQYIITYLRDKPYDMFGFSTICSSYPLTLRMANAVKVLFPESIVVLGGPQASVVDVRTMEVFQGIDFIVRGEAEVTFPKLVNVINNGGKIDNIKGITYRKNGVVTRNGSTPIIESLEMLPFPAYHLYPFTAACESVPLELGRGCPFACTFCSTNDFFRRRFRLKEPQQIIGEMKRIKETYGHSSFDLVHDMFTVNRKKVVSFCEALIDSGEKFFWGCSARTDCIDEELISLMAKAGCRGIFFGIETGSEGLQKLLMKNLDLKEAFRMIQVADKYRIKTAVSLITGFPQETSEDLRDTVRFFMDSMIFDNADPQLCLLAPLAETPLEVQHRDELIFDDIISDMSFQGWEQDAEDRKMIEAHRDIFPNFYSIPTPGLDRRFVKELREFLLNGMSRFRWLLVGLHQDSGDILTVFTRWLNWLSEERGTHPTRSPAMYYGGPIFYSEFLKFLRTDYVNVASAPAVISGLIDYAAAFDPGAPGNEADCVADDRKAPDDYEGLIGPGLTPIVRPGVRLTPIQSDYLKIVAALRNRTALTNISVEGAVTVATSDIAGAGSQVFQLTRDSSEILYLCDGVRTVADVGQEYRQLHEDVEGVPAHLACIVGLEMLRRQGLILLVSNKAGRSNL
jgi:radical SAM superfamily enzyme YgiQ (UPF0313 family)